jgi:hypothetical protein
MITEFSILTGATVPDNYSWDRGVPFDNPALRRPAYIETNYISGYAPGLDIIFNNNSQAGEILFAQEYLINYNWNFGDVYNEGTNNVILSCVTPVRHVYTMPGRYTVTLTHTEVITQSIDNNPLLCRDRYNINWYWDNLADLTVFPPSPDRKTWNETECFGSFPKTWDPELGCLQRHCRYWSWESTQFIDKTPTTWEQARTNGFFEKRWLYESNDKVCQIPEQPLTAIVRQERQDVIKQFMVEVKEILPQARVHSMTRPAAGTSPLTVQLSPRATQCGSFPIDRIDWDFGDGSPIVTITRQGQYIGPEFVFTNVFNLDLDDPRNYDLIHTYRRNSEQYAVFYPSITAYSANTGSPDACSTTIGPIDLPTSIDDVKILKVKNTSQGTLYTIDIDNTCSFVATTTGINTITVPQINIPPNKVRDTFSEIIIYQGNPGNNYPPFIEHNCEGIDFTVPLYGLIVEEETLPLTSPLSALSAIVQENDSYIIVR